MRFEVFLKEKQNPGFSLPNACGLIKPLCY